jgi:hypothetical protein
VVGGGRICRRRVGDGWRSSSGSSEGGVGGTLPIYGYPYQLIIGLAVDTSKWISS